MLVDLLENKTYKQVLILMHLEAARELQRIAEKIKIVIIMADKDDQELFARARNSKPDWDRSYMGTDQLFTSYPNHAIAIKNKSHKLEPTAQEIIRKISKNFPNIE
jgi:hypothetical protein